MSQRGKFIVLEGIDGSGKTTQAQALCRELESRGLPCWHTREPGDSPAGKLLRQILTGQEKMDVRSLAGLFLADRIQHIVGDGGLLEHLEQGFHVVCDRYYFSSYAYHSLDVPLEWVIKVNEEPARLLRPDMTVFVDVDPGETMQRIQTNREQTELFEKLDTLQRVRHNYMAAFDILREKESFSIIDGSGTVEEVTARMMEAVDPLFG